MFYPRCPTCGTLFADKIIAFETEKKKICDNPNIVKEDKDNLLSKLVLNLKFRRYCCTMRMMTYKNLSEDIIPINNN